MKTLQTSPYLEQAARWPREGNHILAQYDDESVVVYQAYRSSVGRFAAEHGYFGGDFSLSRMSWIKPSLLGTVSIREVERLWPLNGLIPRRLPRPCNGGSPTATPLRVLPIL